jgi:hypothetical protein
MHHHACRERHKAPGVGRDASLWCAGSSAVSIGDAAWAGDLAEVQRLIGEDPGLLHAPRRRPGLHGVHVCLSRGPCEAGAMVGGPGGGREHAC